MEMSETSPFIVTKSEVYDNGSQTLMSSNSERQAQNMQIITTTLPSHGHQIIYGNDGLMNVKLFSKPSCDGDVIGEVDNTYMVAEDTVTPTGTVDHYANCDSPPPQIVLSHKASEEDQTQVHNTEQTPQFFTFLKKKSRALVRDDSKKPSAFNVLSADDVISCLCDKTIPRMLDVLLLPRTSSTTSSNTQGTDRPHQQQFGVFCKENLEQGTKFGPLQAPRICKTELQTTRFLLRMMSEDEAHYRINKDADDKCLYLDTSDISRCNWMVLVRPARYIEDVNLVVYVDFTAAGWLYFSSIRPLECGEELRVWYSLDYAYRLGADYNLPSRHSTSSQEAQSTQDTNHVRKNNKPPKKRKEVKAGAKKVSLNFACCLCKDVRFPSITALNEHMTSHSVVKMYPSTDDGQSNASNIMYACRVCSALFDKQHLLLSHLEQSHASTSNTRNEDQAVVAKSEECDTVPKVYRCGHSGCKMVFSSEIYRDQHFLSHSSHDRWMCTPCHLIFPTLELYQCHKILHTDTFGDEPSWLLITQICSECCLIFESRKELAEHVVCHARQTIPSSYLKRRADTPSASTHPEAVQPPDNSLYCKECDRYFVSKPGYVLHMKTHRGPLFFTCALCEEGFRQLNALRQHISTHRHPSTAHFQCPRCAPSLIKTFASYNRLKRHIAIQHSQNRYQCPECEKVFQRSDKYKQHVATHSNQMPFHCDECDKSFRRRDKLKAHHYNCHNQERILEKQASKKRIREEKRGSRRKEGHRVLSGGRNTSSLPADYHLFIYKCSVCLIGFKRRGMLVNHLATKHPALPTSTVPELKLPILRQSRSYPCLYCSKVYRSSTKRKEHIVAKHTGAAIPCVKKTVNKIVAAAAAAGRTSQQILVQPTDQFSLPVGSVAAKPVRCRYCYKEYAAQSKLPEHMRRHHPQELEMEMRKKRQQKTTVEDEIVNDVVSGQEEALEASNCYMCVECDLVFHSLPLYQCHEILHGASSPPSNSITQSTTLVSTFPYCPQCYVTFDDDMRLAEHVENHATTWQRMSTDASFTSTSNNTNNYISLPQVVSNDVVSFMEGGGIHMNTNNVESSRLLISSAEVISREGGGDAVGADHRNGTNMSGLVDILNIDITNPLGPFQTRQ